MKSSNIELRIRTNSRIIYLIVFGIIISSLVLPPIFRFDSISLRLDDLIALSAFVILPALLKQIIINNNTKYFLLFSFFALFSMVFGYTALGVFPSVRDLNEMIRLFKSLIFIMLVGAVEVDFLKNGARKILRYGAWIILIVGLVQYLNPCGLGEQIAAIYGTEHHVKNILASTKRIIITGSNPNDGGAIALYFLFGHVAEYIESRRLFDFVKIFLLFVAVLLTGSRTNFIITIVVMLFVLVTEPRFRISKKIFVSLLFILTTVVLWDRIIYLSVGFRTFVSGDNNSWNQRVIKQYQAIKFFIQSPVFGWGPAKTVHSTIVDGEYSLILRRYGIAGMVFLISFIANAKRSIFNMLQSDGSSPDDYWRRLSLYLTITGFLLMVSNALIFSYQLFYFFAFVQVVAWRISFER